MSNAVAVCHGAFGRAALYRLDREIITHAHREGHLIFSVGGEDAVAIIDEEPVPVTPTTAAAVSPWQLHRYKVPEGGVSLCLVLYIKPIWFLENSRSAEYALQFGSNKLVLTEDTVKLVRRLVSIILAEEERSDFNEVLYDVTATCFNLTWRDSCRSTLLHEARRRFSDFRVRRSLQLMRDNLSADIAMEGLAREVGLSRPHFFKLFKKHVGVSPNIYLNTLRTEHAIEVLTGTDKTVTEIAYDLGFSSQASFTRFFSSNVGIAPSEYRRVAIDANASFAMV
ncbi:MAG: AraC family transcriptional regulator [Pseudomonadota bacterium]